MILLTVIAKIQKKCFNSMVKWRFFQFYYSKRVFLSSFMQKMEAAQTFTEQPPN